MQHPPVIEDKYPPWDKLFPILILLFLEYGVEFSGCIVPRLDFFDGQLDGGSIGRIPPNAEEVTGSGVVF